MPNNILITPGSAAIQFSGSAANTIRLQVEPSGSIAFYGNSGSLFGISDSLSGSLMSVNDISGLPILEVFSDDRVVMGSFNRNTLVVTGSRVGIDKAVPTADLDISGSVFITGSLRMNSGGITGSLFGTASAATSASYVLSASFAPTILPSGIVSSSQQINTGSFTGSFIGTLIGTSSWANNVISSSFATTSSAATSITFTPTTASFATTASAATSITFIPATASYALNATATLPAGVISSSTQFTSLTEPFTGSFTGSFKGDGTGLTGVTAVAFPYVGAAVITGSLTITGSGIDVISGSVTASALKIGNNTTFTDAGGSSTISAGASFLRFRVGGVGFFYNGIGLSPENTLQRDLGATDYQWLNLYTKNIFTSGSITNTGSISILSGSVTSLGPQNGLTVTNGVATSTISATSNIIYAASNAYHLFTVNGGNAIVIDSQGVSPPAGTLNYSLGGPPNRFTAGYINNLFTTGSITHTGSLNILSGSINVTNGGITGSLFGTASNATVAATASYFAGYINFPSGLDVTGSLFVTGSGLIVSGTTNLVGSVTASRLLVPSITGSLFGTSSVATSASYALSASWAPGGSSGLTTKAGNIANSSFTGNPRKAAVNFSSAFATTNYAIVITGEDARSWTVEGKVVGGFTASANSNTGLAGTTYWIATAYGET